MEISEHVISAIDDYQSNKLENALMHACISIEATARNLFKKNNVGRTDYIKCIRNYYWIVEFMIGKGINLEETKWTNLKIYTDKGKLIKEPDLATVIYYIFRCKTVHSHPIPINYKLLRSSDGAFPWNFSSDILHMPDTIIWVLLAVSVFAKGNLSVSSPEEYCLTWGSKKLGLGIEKFVIKDWWGKEEAFREFVLAHKGGPRVKILFPAIS